MKASLGHPPCYDQVNSILFLHAAQSVMDIVFQHLSTSKAMSLSTARKVSVAKKTLDYLHDMSGL